MHAKTVETQTKPRAINILIVEDCYADVVLFTHMLTSASLSNQFKITHAARLIDAFVQLKNDSFDIIILDLDLIDISGTASISAIRAEVPKIPIIVYSGLNDPRVKHQALASGASHYLVKGLESGYALKFMIEETLQKM